MKVLHSTFSASRTGGGIFVANCGLTEALSEIPSNELLVIAPSDQHTQQDKAQWKCPNQTYPIIGPSAFGYSEKIGEFYDEFSPELAHVHGIWMYYSVANLKFSTAKSIPYVVSPHGMLDRWALQNSGWKKRIAATLFERKHLSNAACLHALCDSEAKALRDFGLRNPICVIPNGINMPTAINDTLAGPTRDENRTKTLLFLGRIHSKKGLKPLLGAFAKLPKSKRENWTITIAGWDQGHQRDLQSLAKEIGIDSQVQFVGPKFGDDKNHLLRDCDAFVLPSFSEGLPMSVLEAWSYRKPTIITTACNLPEGLAYSATIECTPNEEGLVTALTQLFALNEHERMTLADNAQRLVETKFTWPIVAKKTMDVYHWLLGQAEMPDTVLLD
jgi:glycosyltransferase involved in cell wall biosynthesis